MAIVPPPPGGTGQIYRFPGLPPGVPRVALWIAVIPALLVLGFCYYWFVQRVEVEAGEVLVLVRKVGQPLPPEAEGQVVLHPALLKRLGEPPDSTKYTGIMYEALSPGRYFFDPFFWERQWFDAVFVKQGEVGIKIRKYGNPLPPGKTVATEPDERGPLEGYLEPGRYNINPYAYKIERVTLLSIPEGFVGVQTLYAVNNPQNPNDYVMNEGERGVQPTVLPPGREYNNPYARRIDLIDVRTQTVDLRDEEAIHFPSNDSFEIVVEGTIQYAVRQDMAPYVMVAIGGHDDIEDKLILPYAKSLARIEGSKLLAREFISGEKRTEFQRHVFEGLGEQCFAQGIEIQAVLFRKIVPPDEIAQPISDRQVAGQQITQYENEMKLAEAEARLAEQDEMQKQNTAIGEANREVVALIVDAEQNKAVALTQADKRFAVAKLKLEAAKETAAALLSRGKADAEIVRLKYEAETKPLGDAIAAFGDGEVYAQYFFYQKLGPALKSVLASTEGPFAEIFRSLSQTSGGSAGRSGLRPQPGAESPRDPDAQPSTTGGQP